MNPFQLTEDQSAVAEQMTEKVVCDVDAVTMAITINVTDQDPLICATLGDSVKTRLQKFITDYRTEKARRDLAYQTKLFKEAKAKYVAVRKKYIDYSDANQEIVLESVRSKLEDAQAKVQEVTPAFTTLQSATVPVRKSGPGRSKICLVFVFVGGLISTFAALWRENQIKSLFGIF